MRTVEVNVIDRGDKFFFCRVCSKAVTFVEKITGCCEECISVWYQVTKLFNKDGKVK